MLRKPAWFKVPPPWGQRFAAVDGLLRAEGLNTVCRSALCPNIGECYNRGTATFLLMGNLCTRRCAYCNISGGRPAAPPDPTEPERLARAVKAMSLRHAVLTSVTRDDVADGGAAHFAAAIRAIAGACPEVTVEVLIPDLQGQEAALATLLAAAPAILNHNLETVREFFPRVRPGGDYDRSLALLAAARRLAPAIPTKSGLLVGLGETAEQLEATLADLARAGCRLVTLGQYLRPPGGTAAVSRYYSPEEFAELKRKALEMGFEHVESGPLVRSSYHAESHAGHSEVRRLSTKR
jgi:lipoic acid synthetase